MTAVLLALLVQQPQDPVVIQKKGSAWTFALTPEARGKVRNPDGTEGRRELDIPAQLLVAFEGGAPTAPGAPFLLLNNPTRVAFYKPGKDYEDQVGDRPELATRYQLAELQETMAAIFFEFDLDFPGGTWEELAKALRDQLSAAYAAQLPEIVKPFLPAKVEIHAAVSHPVRYPAIQAKSISLAGLRAFGVTAQISCGTESVPRRDGADILLESRKVLHRWTLVDANAPAGDPATLGVAFFSLAGKTPLPRAEDVVALFELAWKARGGPIFARVKYHPETKTILLQGTSDEILAAQRAFATLAGRPEPNDASRNPFDSLKDSLDAIAELLREQAKDKEKDK